MSNPWAQSYEDLRRPYLEEKKAKKDYDGDGKVESGSKEHAGVVHNAIQRAKGGKADGKDTRKEEVETVDEKFSMAAKPERRETPRPTKKAENKKGMSLKSRAMKAVGSRRREDKETGISEDLSGMVDKATKAGQGALEKIGVKINRTPRPTARPSAQTSNTMRQNRMSNEETVSEGKKKGLYANIHAKRKRGESPAKPGDEDYPAKDAFKKAAKTAKKEEMEHAEKVEFYGEAYTITNADVKGNTPAYRNYKAGMKSKTTGKPLYNLAPHVKFADSVELEGEMTEANAGPSTPVANYDGKIMPNSGAGRVGRVRLKPGVRMADSVEVEGDAIEEGSMKAARKNVGASTCWKGYKAKGTKMKGGKTVPNCVKEYSDWREEMGEGFFSEAAKRQQSLDIKTSGVKNKVEINPELKTEGACSDKPMERLKTDRDGYRVPQKDADAAKARIMAKTKKKREQAKENIMKGPLLPGEGRKVYPKGAAPKATGAKLPLANSYNPMLDSVEEQALQMIERTRFAKEKGTDSQTGKESKKGGKKPSGAFAAVSAGLRKSGGMMSSRGKAIAPQGKKKEKGAKGPKGVTPVDKIKGQLAKKRAPKPNPYKARAGESD